MTYCEKKMDVNNLIIIINLSLPLTLFCSRRLCQWKTLQSEKLGRQWLMLTSLLAS